MKRILLFAIILLLQLNLFGNDDILSASRICAEENEANCVAELYDKIFKLESDSSIIVTLLKVGGLFLEKGKTAHGIQFLERAENYADEKKHLFYLSKSTSVLGGCYRDLGNMEKAEFYYRKNLSWAEELGDKTRIGLARSDLGITLGWKGEIDLALQNFHEAISVFEEHNDQANIGRPYQFMGILYGMENEEKKSIDAFRKSAQLFRKAGNERMTAWAELNMANTYLQINEPDSAIHYLQTVIPIFEKIDDFRALVNAKTQLGRAYETTGKFNQALDLVNEVTEEAKTANLITQLAYNHRLLSTIHLKMNKPQKAILSAKEALRIHKEIGVNNEYHLALEDLSEAYGLAGDFANAYYYSEEAKRISDSLFSENKKMEMAELEAKFEAEKKAKEIAIVEAEKELEKAKRSRIQLLSLLILITTFLFVGGLIFKNKKDKLLLKKQRDIEVSNRQNTELKNKLLVKDLDLKKRELVSNTLLISKKNEFLKDILKRLDGDKPDPRKLKRLVSQELKSEDDWDNFISVFRDTHSNFIDELFVLNENLSKSELRMACLLKMNLQTKEIGNLLNISSEGVRKAKYRLKQKLGLDTGGDIQNFILAI